MRKLPSSRGPLAPRIVKPAAVSAPWYQAIASRGETGTSNSPLAGPPPVTVGSAPGNFGKLGGRVSQITPQSTVVWPVVTEDAVDDAGAVGAAAEAPAEGWADGDDDAAEAGGAAETAVDAAGVAVQAASRRPALTANSP